jgi:hypothetical protein
VRRLTFVRHFMALNLTNLNVKLIFSFTI